MTQLLSDSATFHSSRGQSAAFVPHIVHVDTDLTSPQPHPSSSSSSSSSLLAGGNETPAGRLLAKYLERFPEVSFECVHLSKVMSVKTVDWAALPTAGSSEEEGDDAKRLRGFMDMLPTLTARSDMMRLLVRHLLVHLALEKSCAALLLGHNTTALAAMTLTEVANGRGFSVPAQINDGPLTVCTYLQGLATSSNESLQVFYPMREVFKNEILVYLTLVPALGELVPKEETSQSANVVSHKDLSIAQVMTRYFENVEGPYSGVVANVVRTAGKLDRPEGTAFCSMCGMALDELGDSTWAGELGEEHTTDDEQGHGTRLCYGCKRSISG
jgi:cytoplasmic tRNA 2-thiolation protein 2